MKKKLLIALFFICAFVGTSTFASAEIIKTRSELRARVMPPPPTVGPFADVCESDPPVKLTTGSPGGGIYSGVGVYSGYFYPGSAGAGTHTITYTMYVSGVQQTATATIKVNPKPKYPYGVQSGTLPFVGTAGTYGGSNCPNGTYVYSTPGCAGHTENYFIPYEAGSTYQWSISNKYGAQYGTGGTIVSGGNTNSVNIKWDGTNFIPFYGGNMGYYSLFKVLETNSFGCVDSFFLFFQIDKPPVSDFTSSTVCVGNGTQFTDQSVDAVEWFWDFGDGTTSKDKNPIHNFTTGGTHQVKLVTKSGCYCKDSVIKTVNVVNTPAPNITCPSTFCPGTSSSYSTDPVCGTYTWVVTGGTITSGQGTPTIAVDWGPNGPTGSVSVQTTGCTPAECSNPTVTNVPLIGPSSSITGKTLVCQYESDHYVMPAYPGSNVTWTLVPASAGSIVSGQGTNDVLINWGTQGTAQIVVSIDHVIISCVSSATLNVIVLPYFYLSTTDYSICKNGNATYTANPSGAVTWTVPDGAGTVVAGQGTGSATINWKNAGQHMIVGKPTNPNTFCNDSSVYYAYVDSVPPPPIDGPLYICPGGTYKYSSLGPNYYVNYVWSAGNGTVMSASGNDAWIQWNGTGPYSLTLTQNNQYAPYCSSAPETIAVYDIAAKSPPITGKDSACVDNMYTYYVPYINGASYSWSVNPPQAGSIIYGQGTSGISIEFTNAGKATITCNTYLCTNPIVSTFQVVINPTPKPPITSAGYLCPTNGSVSLSTSPGYQAYNWTYSGATVGTGQTAAVTSPGYYILYATAKNGCIGKEKIKVPMQQAPIAHISTPDQIHYCPGETVNTNLHAIIASSAGTYQWYFKGAPVGTNNPIYNATDTGTYWLVITNSYGCTSKSNPIIIDKNCMGPGGGCIPLSICGMPPCTPPPPNCISTDSVDAAIQAGMVPFTGGGGTKNFLKKPSGDYSIFSTPTVIKICKQKVNFTNTSLSTTTSWWWDFGDGGSSLLENPSYTYGWPGYYYVTFVGVFSNGQYSVKHQSIEIPFVADFLSDPNCGGAFFTDASMHTTGSPITNWNWDFGDGTTSTSQNVAHTFPAPGTYKVKLTISDASCMSADSASVVIPGPPVAAFTAPAACISFPTSFKDESTGNSLFDWNWDFGDGYVSHNSNPVHTYGSPGTFNVSLTVTDITGCSNTVTHPVIVSAPGGGASITANGPTTFCAGGNVLLTATSAASYQWSNGSNTQYILVDQPGYYSCTITYATGCVEKIPQVYINVLPTPYAYIYGTVKDFICAGTTANLYTGNSTNYSYQWYKDGSPIAGANTYTIATGTTGAYYVVIVDNTNGCSTTTAVDSIKTIQPTPTVSSITGNTTICEGTSTTLSVSASGGTGALTYYWTNGSNQTSITVNTGGGYYVTVQDKNGCYANTNITVTMNPYPNLNGFPVGCYDMCYKDTLRVIGGMASYQWYLNGSPIPAPKGTSQNMVVTADGTYKLVAITNAGCVDTSHGVDITTKPLPKVSAGPDGTICQTGGEVDSLKGSTDGVSFYWTPTTALQNPTTLTPIASPTSNTDYILHAKAANGCKNRDTVTVLVSCTAPKITALGGSVCSAGCVDVSASGAGGGTQPYSYAWSSGQTGLGPHSVCPTVTTSYTVTITDAAGYTGTDTAQVIVGAGVTSFAASVGVIKCKGVKTGTLAVNPSGGTGPYDYLWSNGGTTSTINGLAAANYTVTITDAKGCTRDTILSLIEPDTIVPATFSVAAVCGNSNGSISVSATGGTGLYSYSWSPAGGTAQTASNVPSGNYSVVVSDANACSVSTAAVVANDPGTLAVSTAATAAICGNSNGSVSVSATGGTAAFTYLWAPNGGTGATAANIGPGTYTVTVTDANGCITSSSGTVVNDPGTLAATMTSTNVTCNGQANGTATITASGGNNVYTYGWLPSGGTGVSATALSPGSYTIAVTDGNNCQLSSVVTITQPLPLSALANGNSPLCPGGTGTASITAAGGTSGYTYNWMPGGATAQTVNSLSTGIYTVMLTDANNCTVTSSASISIPSPIVLVASPVDGTCGNSTGSVGLAPSGGTAGYSYLWTPSGGTGQTANGLPANTYTVVLTDANGCTESTTAIVGNSPPVTVTLSVSSDVSCSGGADGSLLATSGGGTAPLNYSWSAAGISGTTGTGLKAGVYSVTINDSKGCTALSSATISEPGPVTLAAPAVGVICIGQNSTLMASASGGTAAYTYVWMPGALTGSNVSVSPTTTTIYSVAVSDAKGCTTTMQSVTVTVNPPLQVDAGIDKDICLGSSGTATAVASGGNSVYTYSWMPTNTNGATLNVNPIVSTTYTVMVMDGCGTPSTSDVVIMNVNPLPVPEFHSDTTEGCAPSVCITFGNSTPGMVTNCFWNFGDGNTSTNCNPTHCYSQAGTYNLRLSVTDDKGCVAAITKSSYIIVHPKPTAAFLTDPNWTTILTPTISFTDKSSTDAVKWSWNFGDVLNSSSNLQNPKYTYPDTGIYTVQQIVSTAYGCVDTANGEVTILGDYTFYVPNAFSPNGDGRNEKFFPQGFMIDPECFKMMIFDRWGSMIYQTTDLAMGWDGRANGGKSVAQQDVYVWKIETCDFRKTRHYYLGHVTLIR